MPWNVCLPDGTVNWYARPFPLVSGPASGQPAPELDPDLEHDIYEAFVTSDGHAQVDLLCEGWLDLARQSGITVDDGHGNLLPDALDAISHTVSAAIWFALTTGYLTLTGRYHLPRKFLTPYGG